MRRRLLGACAVLIAIAMFAGTSQAATYSASVSDALADNYQPEPFVPIDLTRFSVSYDDNGTIEAKLEWAPADFQRTLDYRFTWWLGHWQDASKTCSTAYSVDPDQNYASPHDAWFQMYDGAGIPHFNWRIPGDNITGSVYTDPSNEQFGPTFHLIHFTFDDLRNKGFDCVSAGHMEGAQGVDWTDQFRLTKVVSSPPPSPSFLRWTTPASGSTISGALSEGKGNCLLDASADVTRVQEFVDGKDAGTQLNLPWSCEIDTAKLSNGEHTFTAVAFNKDNKQVATATATVYVKNPISSPPPSPPPPRQDPPKDTPTKGDSTGNNGRPSNHGDSSSNNNGGGTQVTVTGPQINVVQNNTQVVEIVLTKREARKAVDYTLRKKLASYRRGNHRSLTCKKVSDTKRACAASWRYRGKKLHRKVTVTEKAKGYRVRVRVR